MAEGQRRQMQTASGVTVEWLPNLEMARCSAWGDSGESIALSLTELRKITEWVASQLGADDGVFV